jgi:hypothetical protein
VIAGTVAHDLTWRKKVFKPQMAQIDTDYQVIAEFNALPLRVNCEQAMFDRVTGFICALCNLRLMPTAGFKLKVSRKTVTCSNLP